jgi:hypothetical protein
MTDPYELYRPWMINGTYFNRMLQCGARANNWLEHALIKCAPREIFDEWKDKITFLSTANSDAFRIAKRTREERELIFVSEHIIPPHGVSEDHADVRYLIFVALHEFVHVIKQHQPPNEISEEANNAQEAEANDLAFEWFNGYIETLNHPDVPEFTEAELVAAQKKNKTKLEALQ